MKKLLSIPYVIWMAIFICAPMVLVVVYAFSSTDGEFTLRNFQDSANFANVFLRSLSLAAIATVICLIIGYPVAYALSREGDRLQSVVMMLIMLPMWMNFLLRTYAWMSLLENNGLINNFLGLFGLGPFRMINTQGAVVLGMVYNYLPFMILPIYSVIVKIDPSVVDAAHDLGANSYRVFTRVTFPLSLPGVLSGVTMTFVPSVSTFAISKLLGGGKELLLGDLIEMQFLGSAYNPRLGSAISLIMMVLILILMSLMNKFGGGNEDAVLL